MKFLLAIIILFVGINPSVGSEASVVTTTCAVYQEASFDNPLLINEKEVVLKHGNIVKFIEEVGDFSKVSFSYDGAAGEGYIYSYYLTFNKVEQVNYPVFNGKVKNDNASVYDLERNPTALTASKGQGVYLYQGYSSKEEFVAVAVIIEDGSVYYGLMKSADIAPNGVNAGLITGIVVIASCLTIIFLLLFMKKKKKQ